MNSRTTLLKCGACLWVVIATIVVSAQLQPTAAQSPYDNQTTLTLSDFDGVQSVEPVVHLGRGLYLVRIETHVPVTALNRKVIIPQVEYITLSTGQIQAAKKRIP